MKAQGEIIKADPAWVMAGSAFPSAGTPPELDVQMSSLSYKSRSTRGYKPVGLGMKGVVDGTDKLLSIVGAKYAIVKPEEILLHMVRAHLHPTYYGRMGATSTTRDWVMFECQGLASPADTLNPTVFLVYSHNKSRVVAFRAGYVKGRTFLPIPVREFTIRHTKSARTKLKELPDFLWEVRDLLQKGGVTDEHFEQAARVDAEMAPVAKNTRKHAGRALMSMIDGGAYKAKLLITDGD